MPNKASPISGGLSQSPLFFFGVCVAALLYLAVRFFLPDEIGETRDRLIHLSLPVVFEISFLLSLFICRCAGRLGQPAVDSPTSSRLSFSLNLMPMLAGCCFAILANGVGYRSVGLLIVATCLEWLWRRLSHRRAFVALEFICAALIILVCFKAQALGNTKHAHHWSFYLTSLYGSLSGGTLLWDVPSQYGFLSILFPSYLSKVLHFPGITAFGYVLAAFQLVSVLLLFWLLLTRTALSPIAAAAATSIAGLFLPGWLPDFLGPTAYPSVSAYRFLPAFVVLLCLKQANDTSKFLWTILGALAATCAFTWSIESLVYATGALGGYLVVLVIYERSHPRVFVPPLLILLLGAIGATSLIGSYSLLHPSATDLVGFYEHALSYSGNVGTVPMEIDWLAVLYVFTLAFCYFFSRVSLRFSGSSDASGTIFFFYLWLAFTYYIARSHWNNVVNLSPVALLCMLGCPPKLLSEELKKYHRIGITLTSLGLVNYGIMAATATNTQGLAKRITSSTIFVPPVFKEAPSAVTEPFAAQTNVTLLSRWEINKPNQTLQNDGFTLALSPLAHMMVLSQPRRCEYLKRMVDSRGDATVLADPDTQREFVGVLNSCPASVAWEEVPLVHYWKAYQLHKR